jgi:MarC family membrane protein
MGEFVFFYISIFSVVNPFSTIPTWVGLSADIPSRDRRRMTTRTAVWVFLILAGSYAMGQGMLSFFSISVASLRVAGGLLILGMAWTMLQAKVSASKQTPEEAAEIGELESVAVVPMAMPLLAGPGSISLMIIMAGERDGMQTHVLVMLAALAVAFTAWLILQAAGPIAKALGRTGMNVATRFMGLILAALAVEFITSGLGEIFPGWR